MWVIKDVDLPFPEYFPLELFIFPTAAEEEEEEPKIAFGFEFDIRLLEFVTIFWAALVIGDYLSKALLLFVPLLLFWELDWFD